MRPNLSVDQLKKSLRGVGVARGDNVVVHSSLSSLGAMEGGAEVVVDALLDVLGPAGNLVLPTFSYAENAESIFDPAHTPCRTGAIPEAGRKRPGAVRSLHPTHSVTVIGPAAERLTEGHLTVRALGRGSPLDRLAGDFGGKVLLLGVGHTANSTLHVAEEHAGLVKAPRFEPMPRFPVLLPDGAVCGHILDTSPSCSFAFGAAELPLRRRGIIRDARAGSAKLQLMSAQALIAIIAELLAQEPDALLCSNPDCVPCTGSRRLLREAAGHSAE